MENKEFKHLEKVYFLGSVSDDKLLNYPETNKELTVMDMHPVTKGFVLIGEYPVDKKNVLQYFQSCNFVTKKDYLISESKRRGITKGCAVNPSNLSKSYLPHNPKTDDYHYNSETDCLYIDNGIIFEKGRWADWIIKKEDNKIIVHKYKNGTKLKILKLEGTGIDEHYYSNFINKEFVFNQSGYWKKNEPCYMISEKGQINYELPESHLSEVKEEKKPMTPEERKKLSGEFVLFLGEIGLGLLKAVTKEKEDFKPVCTSAKIHFKQKCFNDVVLSSEIENRYIKISQSSNSDLGKKIIIHKENLKDFIKQLTDLSNHVK